VHFFREVVLHGFVQQFQVNQVDSKEAPNKVIFGVDSGEDGKRAPNKELSV
jgi:hypothetical protein